VSSNFTQPGRVFFTGTEYPITVAAVNGFGQECVGDSQGVGTEVAFSLVDEFTTAAPGFQVGVVNTNLSTFLGFAAATPTGKLPVNRARLVGGAFTFSVMFSNATEAYGGRALRLMFTSVFPTIFSNAVNTVFGASKLRVSPPLPRFAVAARRITQAATGSSTFSVEAVDGVPTEWVSAGLLPGGPSVVTSSAHAGSSATFAWLLNPAGSFPLSLDGSSNPDGTLASGRKTYRDMVWGGAPATVGVRVVATDDVSNLLPSTEETVTFQTAAALAVNASSWNSTVPLCTSSPCSMPLTAGGAGYAVSGGSTVTISISMLDSAGALVRGEHESVIEAYLTAAVGTARIADAAAPTSALPIYARMVEGRVVLSLLLLGTTGNTSATTIGFRCPAVRPGSLLKPGESNASAANPCRELSGIESLPITIIDTRPPRSAFFSGAALAASRVIRARSSILDISRSRYAQFDRDVSSRLFDGGLPFVDPRNAESVIVSVACNVDSGLFLPTNDMGSSVCVADPLTGNPQCSAQHGSVNACPRGVAQCLCPSQSAAARRLHVVLQRFLLQSNATVGNATQLEVSFRLDRATAYTGTNEADIVRTLNQLTASVVAMLATPYFQQVYGVDPTSISDRASNSVLSTVPAATPSPTPPTLATPAPFTLPPEAPVSAANRKDTPLLALLLPALLLMTLLA
jgi:hypothetical protein